MSSYKYNSTMMIHLEYQQLYGHSVERIEVVAKN